MTDFCEGLLHLKTIPAYVSNKSVFVRILFKCIRELSDANGCRNIPTEDFYRSVMSYWTIRTGVHILRFANVDSNGSSFGRLSMMQSLYRVVLLHLKANGYEVITSSDGERYDHFYDRMIFEKSSKGFLYVPDSKNCCTLVAIKRK